jgi:hypothetical protein
MQSAVDVIVEGQYYIVRIYENGAYVDVPFRLQEYALSYARGQRIRLEQTNVGEADAPSAADVPIACRRS